MSDPAQCEGAEVIPLRGPAQIIRETVHEVGTLFPG